MSTSNAPNYLQPLKSLEFRNAASDQMNKTTSLSQRYAQVLHSEKYFDVVFHVENTSVKCHKLILSAASKVFEAMFYGPLREAEKDIEILDISPDIFTILINYIYTDAVKFEQLSLEESIELYYCAEKYLLSELSGDCLWAITRKLRFSNILSALELCVCMDFGDLLKVCMTFFTRCCLCDPQYMAYFKCHYLHVSKECVKAIIASNKSLHKQLLWFVYEWCQQECNELGLQQSELSLVIEDLQLQAHGIEGGDLLQVKPQLSPCRSIERSYYKACRPYTIDGEAREWRLVVRSDRFISLFGIVMHSRLTPNMATFHSSDEYNESLSIEISAIEQNPPDSGRSTDGKESDHASDLEREVVIWRHSITKQLTKYNCDLNISWQEGVTLSPDVDYKMRLIWPLDSQCAEYPCSLLSNMVDGIQFRDCIAHYGSLVKGLRFLNLV